LTWASRGWEPAAQASCLLVVVSRRSHPVYRFSVAVLESDAERNDLMDRALTGLIG
jgi:hypothetical protein